MEDNYSETMGERPRNDIFARISNWWRKRTSLNEDIIPAEAAYSKTTYGSEMDRASLVKLHQHQINRLIKEKTEFRTNGDSFADYRCVYSFPKDMSPYIDDVLEAFRDAGYAVINLSDSVEEIRNDHVYLISWYRDNL